MVSHRAQESESCTKIKITKYTWRFLFKRLFAKDRHGVAEELIEFILVFDNSSATSTASSKMWFLGNAVKQSKIALRRNFIILVLVELSSQMPVENSELKLLGLLSDPVKTS